MSKARTPIPPAANTGRDPLDADFDPVPVRPRHDGWTPDRQVDFIEALAASGCVEHAAQAVGLSSASAYALRARPDAVSFRAAWDYALDMAVQRLSYATLSRAIHGVRRPVFFQGEQIGERVYYDERLAMFILARRMPERFGPWIDQMIAKRHPDAPAFGLVRAVNRLADDAWANEFGDPASNDPIAFPATRNLDPEDEARQPGSPSPGGA